MEQISYILERVYSPISGNSWVIYKDDGGALQVPYFFTKDLNEARAVLKELREEQCG